MVLKDEEGAGPQKQVEIFFNSVTANGSETNITVNTLPVIPRIGEVLFLGKHGGYDVSGVRHEYVDRARTADRCLAG